MNNREYLNEEQYQKTRKKLARIGWPMLIGGGVLFASSILIASISIELSSIMGFLGVPCIGIGAFLTLSSKQREMQAFYAQQQMPVAKESIEKMAPTMGTAAKEIAKNVKDGLQEDK